MSTATDLLAALPHRHLIRLWREVTDRNAVPRPSAFAASAVGAARASYISYKDCKKLTDDEAKLVSASAARHMANWTDEEISSLIKTTRPVDAVPSAGRLRGADVPAKGEIAHLLRLTETSQDEFHELCAGNNGRYLIFRLVKGTERLLVSFMRISKPSKDKLAATFTTLRPATFATEERTVQGIIYCSGYDASARVFSIGRLIKSSQIRTTALIMQPRRSKGGAPRTDLVGIRLGLGGINQQPRAYRIWCYQLKRKRPKRPKEPDGEFLQDSLGAFALDRDPETKALSIRDEKTRNLFNGEISNLDDILRYLDGGRDAAIGDD